MFKTIAYQQDGAVATIRLNRPDHLNAINMQMREELLTALKIVMADEEIRALIITGEGRSFCSGGDIAGMPVETEPFTGWKRLGIIREILVAIVTMEKPVIAAVNGYAVGAGCNLALACDLIIAVDTAKFGQSFIKMGLIPDMGGTYFLPRAIGLQRAKQLVFTGDNVTAAEAMQMGIVNQVVPAGNLEATTVQLARRLAAAPTKAIALSKKLLNSSFETDLNSLLDMEAFAESLAFQTEDYQEGRKAFLEKRAPRFLGK